MLRLAVVVEELRRVQWDKLRAVVEEPRQVQWDKLRAAAVVVVVHRQTQEDKLRAVVVEELRRVQWDKLRAAAVVMRRAAAEPAGRSGRRLAGPSAEGRQIRLVDIAAGRDTAAAAAEAGRPDS